MFNTYKELDLIRIPGTVVRHKLTGEKFIIVGPHYYWHENKTLAVNKIVIRNSQYQELIVSPHEISVVYESINDSVVADVVFALHGEIKSLVCPRPNQEGYAAGFSAAMKLVGEELDKTIRKLVTQSEDEKESNGVKTHR